MLTDWQSRRFWRRLPYLENSCDFIKVSELLKRRSTTFQRCRRSLLSDGANARCSSVRHWSVQCSQILSSWRKSLWNSGRSIYRDLVLSRLSSDSATWLHTAVVLRFLASSENCNDQRQTAVHLQGRFYAGAGEARAPQIHLLPPPPYSKTS